jgi:serine protease Do
VFFFTVTGRWLSVFSGPAFVFLKESWSLYDDPLVRELRQAVVQIYAETTPGSPQRQLRGSGFNISAEGLIVTNRHLVDNATSIRISFPGHGTFSATGWAISPYADLAIITLQAADLPVVTIATQPAIPGDELLVIGNPLQFARIANKGFLAGYRENSGRETPFLVVEALIYPGSSGSPLFNDQGEVVGVVFGTLRSSDPSDVRGVAVDAAELRLFLKEYGYK